MINKSSVAYAFLKRAGKAVRYVKGIQLGGLESPAISIDRALSHPAYRRSLVAKTVPATPHRNRNGSYVPLEIFDGLSDKRLYMGFPCNYVDRARTYLTDEELAAIDPLRSVCYQRVLLANGNRIIKMPLIYGELDNTEVRGMNAGVREGEVQKFMLSLTAESGAVLLEEAEDEFPQAILAIQRLATAEGVRTQLSIDVGRRFVGIGIFFSMRSQSRDLSSPEDYLFTWKLKHALG